MWTLYWGVGSKFNPSNYVNMAAVLFMWCVMPAYGAAGYVPALVLERTLYVRERSDGLYLAITYLLAKMARHAPRPRPPRFRPGARLRASPASARPDPPPVEP